MQFCEITVDVNWECNLMDVLGIQSHEITTDVTGNTVLRDNHTYDLMTCNSLLFELIK